MDPGKLRHEVTILKEGTRTSDGGGGHASVYVPIDTEAVVFAAVDPLSGDERLRAMQTQANATHRVTIYYRSDVTAKNRLQHEGRTFKIVAPPRDPDEAHDLLELLCREET